MNPIVDVYAVLSDFDPNFVANIFIFAMLFIFCIALSLIILGRHSGFRHFAPGLLTTLGILGTFLGISIGLVNFNVENIDASIPRLLEGLKMAFITSIMGLGLSVLTKLFETWRTNGEQEMPDEVGPEQIYQAMKLQHEALVSLKTEMIETRKAISGEADASLVTQMQKMRTDFNDGLSETRKALTADSDAASVGAQVQRMERTIAEEFRNFAERISEMGSKQLIQALEQVIKDFNAKLTEQFGENFKRLNDAVDNLVAWQDAYKQQITDMDKQFQQTVQGLETSQVTLGKISDHSAAIPRHMTALETVIRTLEAQLADLDRHLKAFADVQERAVNAMPLIKQQLDQTMNTVKESVRSCSDHYAIMLDNSGEMIRNFKDSTGELHQQFVTGAQTAIEVASQEMNKATGKMIEGGQKISEKVVEGVTHIETGSKAIQASIDKAIEGIETAIKEAGNNLTSVAANAFKEQQAHIGQLSDSIGNQLNQTNQTHDALIERQNQQMQKLFAGLEQSMQKTTAEHNGLIKAELLKIDETMQREIERVMQLMANNLSSITRKFVDDYTLLTKHMGQVVQRAGVLN